MLALLGGTAVSIPLRGDVIGKSSLLEPLQGDGLRYPNRHTSEKWRNFLKNQSILQPESLTVQGIDTPQRSYAVFKDLVECVDEQHKLFLK